MAPTPRFNDHLDISRNAVYATDSRPCTWLRTSTTPLVSYFTLSAGPTKADKIGAVTTTNRTALDVSTTATLTLGALRVVKARFTTPPTLDTPYWITRLSAQP